MYLIQIAPKLILALVAMLIYVKISGKSQLAPMSQLDHVGNMVIGALVGSALLNTNISALESTAVVTFWAILLLLIRLIKNRNTKIRDFIDGASIQLIDNGEILIENFQKVKLSVRDFETLISQKGNNSISELKNVWFEPNGSLTIVSKGETNISILLVEEGNINLDNLKEVGKTEKWLMKQLATEGYDDPKDLFYAEWTKGKINICPYEKKEPVENKKAKEKRGKSEIVETKTD